MGKQLPANNSYTPALPDKNNNNISNNNNNNITYTRCEYCDKRYRLSRIHFKVIRNEIRGICTTCLFDLDRSQEGEDLTKRKKGANRFQ